MSINSRFATVFLLAAASLTAGTAASGAWIQQGERRVTFKATGPGGLGIEGQGNDVSVQENGNDVSISVGLGSIKTGIDLRDRHMREKYLKTAKYPKATFSVEKTKLRLPGGGEVEGRLQLHGVTKSIKVRYEARASEQVMHVTGSTQLNMRDFGIVIPSYLGVTVKPDVTVSLRFDAVDK